MSHPWNRAPVLLATLSCAVLSGCYIDGTHSRDEHRTLDQIRQEHTWAADEIGKRTSANDLGRVRDGDPTYTRRAQRRLQRLLDALDRLAWVREAAPRGLWASVGDGQDQDELAFRFARAGKLRSEAFAEADEVAEALANSPAPGALKWADLRRSLLTLQQSEASEDKVSRELSAVVAKEPELKNATSRFPTLAPPLPRPFVAAAASYLRNHPEEKGELDKLPPELSADGKRIRAALDELPVARPLQPAPMANEQVPPIPQDPTPDERAAVRGRANQAHSEADAAGGSSGLLQLSGDARGMLTSRGLPVAFGHRPGGVFALRYEEPRPCEGSSGTCQTLVDYLFNEQGNLLREEVIGPARSGGSGSQRPARRQPDENAGDSDQD